MALGFVNNYHLSYNLSLCDIMKKHLSISLLLLVLGINLTSSMSTIKKLNKVNYNESHVSSLYTDHDPISIDGDAELSQVANSGTGSSEDPYLIEGWDIPHNQGEAISIQNTTKYFRIQNCWLENSNTSFNWMSTGILIDSCLDGTVSIHNNTWHNERYGIFINNINCSVIRYNSGYNSGMYISNSKNTTISQNKVEGGRGVLLTNSSASLIENNSFSTLVSFYSVVSISYSPYTCLRNNNISKGLFGINIYSVNSSTISNNKIVGCVFAIRITRSSNSIVLGNIIINSDFGIHSVYADYLILKNNTVIDCSHGIEVRYSNSLRITSNSLKENGYGVWVEHSESGVIANNHFINNRRGIVLDDCKWYSLTANRFQRNSQNIILKESITLQQIAAILSLLGFLILIVLASFNNRRYPTRKIEK